MTLKLKEKKKVNLKDLIFLIKKIEKATSNLNGEMDEAAKDFYTDKEDKEKDDGLSL